MTTVSDIATKKKITTVAFTSAPTVRYQDEKTCLLDATNERGSIEILLAGETRALLDAFLAQDAGTMTGFFRRRSTGYLADGTRHYIWTFCPTSVEAEAQIAA